MNKKLIEALKKEHAIDITRARTTDPPSIFREMIDRQELGVKTGKGFYKWTPQRAEEVWQQLMQRLVRIAKWS